MIGVIGRLQKWNMFETFESHTRSEMIKTNTFDNSHEESVMNYIFKIISYLGKILYVSKVVHKPAIYEDIFDL